MRTFYRRTLPHWQPPGAVIFVTYRLFGSLPAEALERLADEKRRLKLVQVPGETARQRALREGRGLFALVDQALDSSKPDLDWLCRQEIASIIIENLFHHAGRLYELWAFVVMPNHVHLLLEPKARVGSLMCDTWRDPLESDFVALDRITHALKSYTANRANQTLKRQGTFWQQESYDHWIRDEDEFARSA